MTSAPPCIVLAGGLGTRLRSAVPDLPKCLAPVGSRSFLEIQLESLAAQGIGHFVLSLGYLADKVEAVVEPLRSRFRIDCVVERVALGTGGATWLAMASLPDAQEVLVTNGDTWLDGPLAPMLRPLDIEHQEWMRLAALHVDNRARYGGLVLAGERVTGFMPKGDTGAGPINAGLYRLHRRAFAAHEVGSAFSLETVVMPDLVAHGAMTASSLTGAFIDIGIPEDYQRFCAQHG